MMLSINPGSHDCRRTCRFDDTTSLRGGFIFLDVMNRCALRSSQLLPHAEQARRWRAKRPCQNQSVSRSCRQLVQAGETLDAVAHVVTAVPPADPATYGQTAKKSPEQRRKPMTIDRRTFV